MDKLASMKPYAVFWSGTLCSVCYTELARKKVVSFGGSGFSEEFRQALKPYNYDAGMSSTRMAKTFAGWWCNQLAGKNAIFAGGQNPAQDFRKQKRQLGVISTNDPDNERVIKKVLYPELAKCGESTKGHEYFYEQDINTAAQQTQAGIARMNTAQNPATSVVCFCDPVAPQFSYGGSSNNNYWPEPLFATNQAMDFDASGQSYEGDLACPQRSRGCAFDGGARVWGSSRWTSRRRTWPGRRSTTPVAAAARRISATSLDIFWTNYNMLASLHPEHRPQPDAGQHGGPGAPARQPGRRLDLPGAPGLRGRRAVLDPRRAPHLLGQEQEEPLQRQGGLLRQGRRQALRRSVEFPKAAQPAVPTYDKR